MVPLFYFPSLWCSVCQGIDAHAWRRALHRLLPAAEAAAAAAAAAAAGWLSVWHGARGTAWQTPWPQRYLPNRP